MKLKINDFFYYVFPRSIALVSVASEEKQGNICVVAWHTPISHDPSLYAVAISPKRLTHSLIKKSKNFVVNFLDIKYFKKIHICGRQSGRKINKFDLFHAEKSKKVTSPRILESYLSLECNLKKEIRLGDHSLFVGEVIEIKINKKAFKNRIIRRSPCLFLGKSVLGDEFYCSIGGKYKVRK